MDKSDIFDIKMILWMILSVVATSPFLGVFAAIATLIYAGLTIHATYKESKKEKINETI